MTVRAALLSNSSHIVILPKKDAIIKRRKKDEKESSHGLVSINKIEINGIVNKIQSYFPGSKVSVIPIEILNDKVFFQELYNVILNELELTVCEEGLYFNVNQYNYSIKSTIEKLSQVLGARLHFLTISGELIHFALENTLKKRQETVPGEKELSYEKLLLNSLDHSNAPVREELEALVDSKMLAEAVLTTKHAFNDVIELKNPEESGIKFEYVKLLRIDGLSLKNEDNVKGRHIFMRNMLEALNYFGCKIIRILLNDKKGFRFYLGILHSGNNPKDVLKSLQEQFDLFKKVLVSGFPNLKISFLNQQEHEDILEFVENRGIYGCLTGHATETITNSVLSEINNALNKQKWGFLTIGESLNQERIKVILSDLKDVLDAIITPDEEFYFNEIDNTEKTREFTMRHAKFRAIKKIGLINKYIRENATHGLWDTFNYIFADKKSTYYTIYAIIKSHFKNQGDFWFPVDAFQLGEPLNWFPKSFKAVTTLGTGLEASSEFKPYRTIYSSHRLGDHINLPTRSISNFKVLKIPDFSEELPEMAVNKMANPLRIGRIKRGSDVVEDFYLDLDSLTRHCLVIGSTGSGKTNTVLNILMKSREKKIPFLVVEPIKKEYRHVLNHFKNVEVYSAGAATNRLKINLFEVPRFLNYTQWVNELLEVISNTFYIWYPFRDVIYTSLVEIYQVNGWTEIKRGRTPTLEDFFKYTVLKIRFSSYDYRTKDGFLGAFEARFGSLLKGTRGQIFNSSKNHPNIDRILKKNVILELDSLRNNEERALVFNYIVRLLYLYQQQNKPSTSLRHITVLEEAHRLLSSARISDRSKDSIAHKSQEDFSDILAEIRAYGEGFIISEQKPRQLNQVAITNTELKICHKIPSRYQIEDFRDSLGLSAENLGHVTRLAPGECVIKLEQYDQPFLVVMDLVKPKDWGVKDEIRDEELENKSCNKGVIEQLHYQISGQKDSNEYSFIISEISINREGTIEKIKFPSKKACFAVQNFSDKLWERLRGFHANYVFCSNCPKVFRSSAASKARCPKCNDQVNQDISVKIPILNMQIEAKILEKTNKLHELFERAKGLSTTDTTGRLATLLKQEFSDILLSQDNSENKP
ncbi:MAG: ATP-binding protein [Candidatus Lokiarchaeota archaeon]|nr:ATP-binding protein [Candidatus Lokiarchaeota archaeon]